MLLVRGKVFSKANFNNEEELERVVKENYELLFGEYSIYLSQKEVKTSGGFSSIPDAVVLNFKDSVWYLVEVELADHGVWSHIVPQVTKQIVAVENPEVRSKLVELFMNEVKRSDELKSKFAELGISEMEIRKVIEETIEKPPIVAIPIDHIPVDLKVWASVLKNEVRLLEIEKFVDREDSEAIYKLPEYIPSPPIEAEKGEKIKISREEFLAKCDEPARYLFIELEKIAAERGDYVRLEPRSMSFSFKVRIDSKEMTLLTIYSDGVCIMKYNLVSEKGFKPEAVEAFAEEIKRISSISDRYDIMKQPCFSTRSTDISIDDIRTFVNAVKELLNNITGK